MEEVFFIDDKGKKYYSEKIASHIGLAYKIMSEKPELKKEFEESKKLNPTEFFISNKGYITICDLGDIKDIVYNSNTLTTEQKKWILYFKQEGSYSFKDVSKERKNLKAKTDIKNKDGNKDSKEDMLKGEEH